MKWFKQQSRLVQILLLLIPGLNWFTEVVVRWTAWLDNNKPERLIMALLVTFTGLAFGWVDLVWNLLFDKFIFE